MLRILGTLGQIMALLRARGGGAGAHKCVTTTAASKNAYQRRPDYFHVAQPFRRAAAAAAVPASQGPNNCHHFLSVPSPFCPLLPHWNKKIGLL